MPGSAGSCQAGRGIGWLALAQRKGDAGTRQANAAGRSPPGPAESGTHRQSPRLRRGSSTHSRGPGTPARGDPPQQPRVTGLQQAGPGALGRGGVSRSHQPHQPLMQHSIGGGAPWPGLVIDAAVYPKIPLTFGQPERRSRLLSGGIRRPAIATVAGIVIGGLALAVAVPARHDATSRAPVTTRTQRPPTIDVLIASTVSFPLKGTPGALLQLRYLQTGDGPAAIWATLAASGLPRDTSYYTATAGDCVNGHPTYSLQHPRYQTLTRAC